MHRSAIGLLLTVVQVVAALAPIAMCDTCRESGGVQLAFAAQPCKHCVPQGSRQVSSADDASSDPTAPGPIGSFGDKHSKTYVSIGNQAPADVQLAIGDLMPETFVIAVIPTIDDQNLTYLRTSSLTKNVGGQLSAGVVSLRC